MTVRATSLEAYESLKKSGALSSMRLDVYDYLFKHGPSTSGEYIDWRAKTKYRSPVLDQSRAIFTHLHQQGLIQEVGRRPCRITGKTCIEWDVTSRADPIPSSRKTTKQRLIEAEVKILELEEKLRQMCPDCAASRGAT